MTEQQKLYSIIAQNIELQERLERQEDQLAELTNLLMVERQKNSRLHCQADRLRERNAELENSVQPQKEKTVGWLPGKHQPDTNRKESIDREVLEVMEKKIVELKMLLTKQEQSRMELHERLIRAEQQLNNIPQPVPARSAIRVANAPNIVQSDEYKQLEANYASLQEQYEGIIAMLNDQLTDTNRKMKVMQHRLEEYKQHEKQLLQFKQSEFHVIG